MTDRELLELAAKAAGMTPISGTSNGWLDHANKKSIPSWNPLTDDGDALRLAVACRLFDDDDFIAELRAIWMYPTQDDQADVRRAIVMAAGSTSVTQPSS